MAQTTRQIGLSLGADICWPAAYEALIEQLDLTIVEGDETVTFETDRVTIEPFNLRATPKYDLVIDRLTHWWFLTREWVKKISLMDDVYVLNNPWTIQSTEKHSSYCAMMRLGMPIPETWMIPPKVPTGGQFQRDVPMTLKRYGKLFDLRKVAEAVGYPAFLKPYDGGGWVGVTRVTNDEELRKAYDESGDRVQHLQAAVKDWDLFVRGIGIGPQVLIAKYDPSAPLHARYAVAFHFLEGDEYMQAIRTTRVINAFHCWDFNSCEMLRADGTLHPIDFANACPDSQVTSIHFYFPELVKMLVRWTLFCAYTKRKPNRTLAWEQYFAIADRDDLTYDEKLVEYDALARDFFQADAFSEFVDTHLTELDAIAHAYFGSDDFHGVVREKVAALFPEHEIDQFTEHFFGLIQFWRKAEGDRIGVTEPPAEETP